MLPFQAAHYAMVPTWEGKIPYLYLDTHKDANGNPAPLVTVGIGCAIELAEALTLPFTIGGVPATPEQIQAGFAQVQSMAPGRVASFYQYPNCLILTEDGIAALVQKRYDAFTADLVAIFPDLLTAWPVPAQEGALDLIWGVGPGGIRQYTHWTAYAKQHNWTECAETCGENVNNQAYALRNAWRKQLFLDAA